MPSGRSSGKISPVVLAALAALVIALLIFFRNDLLYSCSEVRVGDTTLIRYYTNRFTGTEWTLTPFGEWTIRR